MFDTIPPAIDGSAGVRHAAAPSGGDRHLPPFCRELGLTADDLVAFGPELRVSGRLLQARHTDHFGLESGWELIRGERLFGFVPGGRKSLFRSPPATRKTRLFLADGPLPALCAAALERRHTDSVYAAPGGPWTRAAAEAFAALLDPGVIREVVLGFGPGPAGLRATEQASAFLRERTADDVSIGMLMPTAGSWMQALREARRGAAAA